MNLSGRYGTTRRVIHLIRLLQVQQRSYAELEAELKVGLLQLARDIDFLKEEGFDIQKQGRPVVIWIHRVRDTRDAKQQKTSRRRKNEIIL